MKKKFLGIIFTILVFVVANATPTFAWGKTAPKLTEEQLKVLQTKEFSNKTKEQLIKAAINTLQDKSYFIEQIDSPAGLIIASKEVDTRDKYINVKQEFGCSKKMTGIKRLSIARTEIDVNVNQLSDKSTVRISYRKKILNMYNVAIRERNIQDQSFYTGFFNGMDKELNTGKI